MATDYERSPLEGHSADHHTDMETDYSFLKSLRNPPKRAGESEGSANVREHLTNRSGSGQGSNDAWKS